MRVFLHIYASLIRPWGGGEEYMGNEKIFMSMEYSHIFSKNVRARDEMKNLAFLRIWFMIALFNSSPVGTLKHKQK